MKYSKKDAKAYAQANMKGVWAAALTPLKQDFAIDETGFRSNLRHWAGDLKIDGVFVAGKQGEFFSMSLDERKKLFDIAASELQGKAGTIMSCSDQNMDTVIELAKHAQKCGADYIVVHAPILHFTHKQDESLYQYYKYLSDNLDIGIAMWSHPDSGYLMTPQTCARIADLPNIVAIKYSVPGEMYIELTNRTKGKLIVSPAREGECSGNSVDRGWRLYRGSPRPYLLQTKNDLRMRQYTYLAMEGKVDEARRIRDSFEPVRQALKKTRPAEKPQAQQKYWQELLGQAGGPVRRPMLQLTDAERTAIRAAFETCGLNTSAKANAA